MTSGRVSPEAEPDAGFEDSKKKKFSDSSTMASLSPTTMPSDNYLGSQKLKQKQLHIPAKSTMSQLTKVCSSSTMSSFLGSGCKIPSTSKREELQKLSPELFPK